VLVLLFSDTFDAHQLLFGSGLEIDRENITVMTESEVRKKWRPEKYLRSED